MKKQQIETLQNTLEGVMQEWINTKQELAVANIQIEKDGIAYDDLMGLYVKQCGELEDTQEALRRCRNQLDSHKMFESLFVSEQVTADILESSLKSAESAIRMYENMNPYTFFIHKYFK